MEEKRYSTLKPGTSGTTTKPCFKPLFLTRGKKDNGENSENIEKKQNKLIMSDKEKQ